MGKSDKKVKSDRINALRKQYDAFLEEDKRRKERNEYILGRLDKMRFCTAIVPVRHKHNVFVDRKDIINPSLCQPVHTTSLSHHTLSVDVPRKSNEDTFYLQEISKKYILIPKTRPISDVNVNLQPPRPNFEDNTDWKSKYDILEQLKRDEKESDISTCENKYDENNKANLSHEVIEINKTNPRHENNETYDTPVLTNTVKPQATVPYKYEVPERDKDANTSYELHEQAKINIQNEEYRTNTTPETATAYQNNGRDIFVERPQASELDPNFTHSNNKQTVKAQVNDNVELQSNLEFNINTSKEPVYDTDLNNENMNENETHYPAQDPSLYDNQYVPFEEEKDGITDTEKEIYVDENESKPIEVMSPNDFVNEINDNAPVQENSKLQENNEYPDTINVQEYTPAGEAESQDHMNINPESYFDQENYNPTYQFDPNSQIVAEHTDEPVDTTGIQAFETEQQEMFYSENADQNYAYNEDGTAEGAYNQDLTVQSSYPQNEENVYYEGAENVQDYPIEMDEHAEANQHYDPNYEEQYGAAYSQQYQQEGYDQAEFSQQPHYEPEIIDQAQQGIEQLQFEEQPYETAEHVEQQLDNEQGFEVQKEQINIDEIQTPIEILQTDETTNNHKT